MILRGDLVVLRPFRRDEVEILEHQWGRRDARVRPRPPLDREQIRRRVVRSGTFFRGRLDLAIETGGRLIGDIQARRHPAQTLPPGTMELGIEIFDADDRGRGYGSDAVAVLTGWLFARAGAERIQVSTATDNVGMRGVLDRLGFRLEGVLRDFMPAESSRDDYAMYAVTPADWESTPGRRPPTGSG